MADPEVTAGVDLGGTKIQTVVLRDGEVAGSARVLTPQTGAADDVIEALADTIRQRAGARCSGAAGPPRDRHRHPW